MFAVHINYLAVLVAAVASMVLGAIWYSRAVFAPTWMQLLGKTEEEVKKGSPGRAMFFAFIANLVQAYILAHFVGYVGAATFSAGLQLGFWVWLGFVATVTLSAVLFEGRPKKLYFLNNGYNLLNLLITAAILSVWR